MSQKPQTSEWAGQIWLPFKVLAGDTGAPRIVDALGKPVCAFGNQANHRGFGWAWTVARTIVRCVNEQWREQRVARQPHHRVKRATHTPTNILPQEAEK